jgi:uncharacterized membrane protein
MKIFLLLLILFIAGCNESSDSAPALPDTVEKDKTTVIKTPEVDTTADMLDHSLINNKAWEQKKANGISWLGIGTEPFWSVERKKDSIIFQLSEWERPVVVKAKRTINSKDSVVYTAGEPSQKLQTTIIPGTCSDGMSDRKYDYAVKVTYNGQTYKGCAVIF